MGAVGRHLSHTIDNPGPASTEGGRRESWRRITSGVAALVAGLFLLALFSPVEVDGRSCGASPSFVLALGWNEPPVDAPEACPSDAGDQAVGASVFVIVGAGVFWRRRIVALCRTFCTLVDARLEQRRRQAHRAREPGADSLKEDGGTIRFRQRRPFLLGLPAIFFPMSLWLLAAVIGKRDGPGYVAAGIIAVIGTGWWLLRVVRVGVDLHRDRVVVRTVRRTQHIPLTAVWRASTVRTVLETNLTGATAVVALRLEFCDGRPVQVFAEIAAWGENRHRIEVITDAINNRLRGAVPSRHTETLSRARRDGGHPTRRPRS
jgi:hypothetical protein